MSAKRGETLTPNPNECNSTLTSGTKNIYPYPYRCQWSGSPVTIYPCATTTHEIHLRLLSHRSRTVTLSNQSDLWNVNLPVFTGASPFSYRFWFCSHGYTIISVVNISHQNKQKESHLPTKFIKHRRTWGKFILLNLKKHWKNSREFCI